MPAKTLLHRHKRPFLLRRLYSFLQVLSPRPRLPLRSGEANKRIRLLQRRTVQLPGLPLLLSPGMDLTKDGVKADQVRVLDRQMLRLHNLAGYERISFLYFRIRLLVFSYLRAVYCITLLFCHIFEIIFATLLMKNSSVKKSIHRNIYNILYKLQNHMEGRE
jgi:hypothetical protein